MVAPLRVRDFRLLWSGNLVSLLGDGIFTVALALEALRVDHQPTGLAYVLACRAVPSVVLAIGGGVVADRISRRAAMAVAGVVRGITVAVIALLIFQDLIALWQLIAMAIVFGTADALGEPAFLAVIPELLPAEHLARANALNGTSGQLASNLVGPALGGVAVAAVGTAGAFGLDAVSFAVLLGCLLAMQLRARPASSGKSFFAEAREGIHYLVSRRWLFLLLLGASFANLTGMGPYMVLLPVMVRHVLHGSPLELGLVYAAAGATGAVAALVVARLGSPQRLLVTMWTAYCTSGLLVALIYLAPDVLMVGVLSSLAGALVVYGDVLYFTRLQTSVPHRLLGRVSSVSYVIVMTLTPLGMLLGGLLAATIGTRSAFLLSGLLSMAAGLVLLVPGARDVEALPEVAPAT